MGLLADLTAAVGAIDNMGNQRAMQSIVSGLESQLGKFTAFAKDLTILEQRFTELQTSMGLTIEQTAVLGQNIDDFAENIGVGGKAIIELQKGLKGVIGPFSKMSDLITESSGFGKDMLRTSKALQMNLRLSSDIANKYIEMASQSGKSLEKTLADHIQISNYIEGQVGGIEVTQEMISEMATQTADVSLHFGRLPGQLELAVIKSKQLGINMAQLKTTGDNLLNIETSIGQEMEYQLLSGRRLVDNQGKSLTNKYREQMIAGKSSDMASTLNQILEQEGDTLRTNMFARKQMAELLNMDEATLARMLKKQDILKKLDPSGKLMGLTGEELAAQMATMTNDATLIAEVMSLNDVRTTDEKMNDLLDQLATKGIRLQGLDYSKLMGEGSKGALGGTQKYGDFLTDLVDNPAVLAAIRATQTAAASVRLGGIAAGAPGGLVGLAVGGTAISKTNPMPVTIAATGDMQDFYSGPGGGRLLLGPAGAMSINNNDVVMGGTDLFKGGGGGDVMQMAAAIVSAINNQTRELKSDPVFGRGLSNSYYG
jgi:hypothetical protein